jgi:cytochrome c6
MMKAAVHLALLASLVLACGSAAEPQHANTPAPGEGEVLFNMQCANCHGRKGTLGISGAKDLSVSTLSRDSMIAVVVRGRGTMMPYGELFDRKQIQAVVDHALSLRRPLGAEAPAP